MKALELTVYPLLEKVGRNARPGYIIGKRGVSVAEAFRAGLAKRLTDAELAAEYWGVRATLEGALITAHDMTRPWRSDCASIRDSMTDKGKRIREQVDTLLRFATLPHYDEKEMNA